jgi:hypothetical protein
VFISELVMPPKLGRGVKQGQKSMKEIFRIILLKDPGVRNLC